MSFWDVDDKLIMQKVGGRGQPPRRKFAIVRYEKYPENPRLVVPSTVGATAGQKVRFKLVEGGVAFRISDEGEYSLFKPAKHSKTLVATLPEELCRFAGNRITDITTLPYHGGWFIPFDQFEKKKGG